MQDFKIRFILTKTFPNIHIMYYYYYFLQIVHFASWGSTRVKFRRRETEKRSEIRSYFGFEYDLLCILNQSSEKVKLLECINTCNLTY